MVHVAEGALCTVVPSPTLHRGVAAMTIIDRHHAHQQITDSPSGLHHHRHEYLPAPDHLDIAAPTGKQNHGRCQFQQQIRQMPSKDAAAV